MGGTHPLTWRRGPEPGWAFPGPPHPTPGHSASRAQRESLSSCSLPSTWAAGPRGRQSHAPGNASARLPTGLSCAGGGPAGACVPAVHARVPGRSPRCRRPPRAVSGRVDGWVAADWGSPREGGLCSQHRLWEAARAPGLSLGSRRPQGRQPRAAPHPAPQPRPRISTVPPATKLGLCPELRIPAPRCGHVLGALGRSGDPEITAPGS